MKKMIFLTLLIPMLGCPNGNPFYGYKYPVGTFPSHPVNLESINSAYDDYNASAPFIREVFPLCFSSNRSSLGGQMDLVYKLLAIDFDKETGEFAVYHETDTNLDVSQYHHSVQLLINRANSQSDEFGPYIKSLQTDISWKVPVYDYGSIQSNDFLLLYATDTGGTLDLHFVHNFGEDIVSGPIVSLNTSANEAYPCFSEDYTSLYFCSDRDGDFNIFQTIWDPTEKVETGLEDQSPRNSEPVEILNSDSEDKCPYIDQNILVFASDRAGGLGGFDLYYSIWVKDKWTSPANFGAPVNSEHDEYRPMLHFVDGFTNQFLVFSSNRPGGLGGFDLYYAGVEF